MNAHGGKSGSRVSISLRCTAFMGPGQALRAFRDDNGRGCAARSSAMPDHLLDRLREKPRRLSRLAAAGPAARADRLVPRRRAGGNPGDAGRRGGSRVPHARAAGGNPGHRHRPRLQPPRPRRRRGRASWCGSRRAASARCEVEGNRIRVGAALADKRARGARLEAGLGGFAFYHGIPGGIGGALRMNAGANGVETRERVVEVVAIDRRGERHVLSNADMGYTYRHSSAPDDFIFVEATYEGAFEDREKIRAEMDAVQAASRDGAAGEEPHRRLDLQEPDPGRRTSAWQLIDAAGCRGLQDRRRAGLRDALQFPHQHRRGERPRPGAARRDGAGAGAGKFRRAAGMGDQADRQVRRGRRGRAVPGAAEIPLA